MRIAKRFPIVLRGVAAVAFAAAVCAAAMPVPAAGLRDRVKQAKKEFQPVTQQDVDEVRIRVA